MPIFQNISIFHSFEAGNCVSNSSFKWMKNRDRQFSRTMVRCIVLIVSCSKYISFLLSLLYTIKYISHTFNSSSHSVSIQIGSGLYESENSYSNHGNVTLDCSLLYVVFKITVIMIHYCILSERYTWGSYLCCSEGDPRWITANLTGGVIALKRYRLLESLECCVYICLLKLLLRLIVKL